MACQGRIILSVFVMVMVILPVFRPAFRLSFWPSFPARFSGVIVAEFAGRGKTGWAPKKKARPADAPLSVDPVVAA
ncbi:hypothetical protein MACH15_16140 [Maricaulis maris]|jgi:hypothetical protein|nr:hypothetical protein MACH15_16140 [Maricaulis maris]